MKKSKVDDLDETGVFGIFCARHGTMLSLQSMKTGESLGYLDHGLLNLLEKRGYDPEQVHLFYDIACQYKGHFLRSTQFNQEFK